MTLIDNDGPAGGSADLSFAPALPPGSAIHHAVAQPGGGAVVFSYSDAFGPLTGGFLAHRLRAGGLIDAAFTRKNLGLPGWSLIAGRTDGSFVTAKGYRAIESYTAGGEPDPAFPRAMTNGGEDSLIILADGSVVFSGNIVFGTTRHRLYKLRTDGSYDPDFSADQTTLSPGPPLLAADPDGTFLIHTADGNILRLLPDGRPDPGFTAITLAGTGKVVFSAGGKIVVLRAGQLRRHRADGTLDPGFAVALSGAGGILAVPRNVFADLAGRILVVAQTGTGAESLLFRLNDDGTPDAAFFAGRGFDIAPKGCLALPDGACLFHGDFTRYDGLPVAGMVRVLGR